MIRYTARAVPWGVLGAGAGVMIGLLLLVERWPYTLWPLQGTAVGLLAATVVWCYPEPAAAVVDTLPRGLGWRTAARSGAALAVVLVWLVAVRQTRTGYFGHAVDVAWQGVALVVAAAGLVTWQRSRGSTGPARSVSAGVVGVAVFVSLARPFADAVPVFPYLADDNWSRSRLLWTALPVSVLLIAGYSRFRTVDFRNGGLVAYDVSPTARTLMVLELIQNAPGITAEQLGDKLGVSERAARRYVAILREADVPIESVRGPYGGYRVGRGLRLPPLMFSNTEALGLVMAVLEGPRGADDPVDDALGKIIRVLPQPIARATDAVRRVSARGPDPGARTPDPSVTAQLVSYSTEQQRVLLEYERCPGESWTMDVDPWAVVVRRGRWYLLCWSHSRSAKRVLRVDKVRRVEGQGATFTPPADLDPLAAVEEHLALGWKYTIEVVIDAPLEDAACWIPRSMGRLEPIDADHTRLLASTNEPHWYAGQLTAIRSPYRIVGSPELRDASRDLAQRLLEASGS
ncbi:helix-turn-helix transcriptional regulator [Kribbella sp. CA-247076]|uniref:helix-turn-helix transcriptional regulator n=1 Tax=Kribbella sp. CA-247076 TaxID=3239941 RepID=UPI003D8D2FBC